MTMTPTRRQQLAGARARKRQQLGPPPDSVFCAAVVVTRDMSTADKAALERHLVNEARHATWPYVLRTIAIAWGTPDEVGVTSDHLAPDDYICRLRAEVT